MQSYPKGFSSLLWSVLALLLLSGLLLTPGALEMRLEWDIPWRLPGGWRVGVAAAHALGAFLGLFVIGALASVHMRAGLRRRQSLWSGFTTATTFGLLALTGLGVYYVAAESASVWLSVGHLVLGILAVVPVVVHTIRGRRLRAIRLREARYFD